MTTNYRTDPSVAEDSVKLPSRNAESPASAEMPVSWPTLMSWLEETEDDLTRLTECLQAERECIALFDIENLMVMVDEKQRLLDKITLRRQERRSVLQNMWMQTRLIGTPMPDSVPEVLRLLADTDVERNTQYLDMAERLTALMDVVAELTNLNRTLVNRALSWIDNYIGEIRGDAASKLYTARGRLRSCLSTPLRRTI